MKKKKLLATLLTATLAFSLTACGGVAEENTAETVVEKAETTTETAEEAQPEAVENKVVDGITSYGGLTAMADADDPITFTYFLRDSGVAPSEDNPFINKIQELTGVTLKYEYLVGDLDQKLGVMMAGGDYPDLIFAGDSATKLISEGALIPLEDYLPNYPNLWAMYKDTIEEQKQEDGHVYQLEMYAYLNNDGITSAPPIFEAGIGFFVQKAVLEWAGYPEIKTLDQYFDVIEGYMAENPTIDGVATRGFEILNDGWRNWGLINEPQCLKGASNDGAMFVDTTKTPYESSFYQISEEAHTFYKKLNEEYNKGVINAECLTENYDQYIANITSGSVLGFFDQRWNFQQGEFLLKNDGKYERTYVAVPVTAPGVKDGYVDGSNGLPTGSNGVGISINCKNPERVLAYFDWLLQREVQDYLRWGIEGTDWNYTDGNSDRVLTDEAREIRRDTAKARDLTGNELAKYTPGWWGLYQDGCAANTDQSAAEYLAQQTEYDQAFLEAYNIQYPAELLSPPTVRPAYYPIWAMNLGDGSEASVVNEKITDLCVKSFSRMVLAKDETEYENLWSTFLTDFDALNTDALKDEVDRQIAAKMGW